MASTIKIKNSSTAGAVPTSSDLVQGELAINVTDRRIFTKNASGTVVELGTPSIDDNGNATAITIDSSENVGIGTSSPTRKLEVSSNDAQTDLMVSRVSNGLGTILRWDNTAGWSYLYNNGAYPLLFGTNNIERARIDSSGNLLVGNSSAIDACFALLSYNGNAKNGLVFNDVATSGSTAFIRFRYNNSLVGSVTTSGSTTSFNTASDYRLKENVEPMVGALEKVALLKPCTYSWKETGEADQGFIAHELQEVFPAAVTGEKDAVNEDGSINPQGIDTSFLVATLTAAIQEQQAIITQLQADVEALKGQ